MDDLIQRNIDYYNTMDWLRDLYKGIHILKFKTDLNFYEELLRHHKPDIIVETGTLHGGSALWFQDHIKGQVITVDNDPAVQNKDLRIKYVIGSSIDGGTLNIVKASIPKNSKVMVVLDADHTKAHVEKEIEMYAPLVTKGMPFVIEDTMFKTYFGNKNPANHEDYSNGSASDAVEEWDKKGFRLLKHPEITMNPGGWWLKK